MAITDTYIRAAEHGMSCSGVKTADVAIKTAPGKVYWLTISDTEANDQIQLNDSTADGGTDVWQLKLPATTFAHIIFDPPLEFATGIYLDVPAGTPDVIVGYI